MRWHKRSGITWHDIVEVSTKNSLSVDVLSDNKKIGSVELDADIIRSACHTTDPTLLKVREVDDDEEDVENLEDASRKKKPTIVCMLDLAMQVIDSDKTFSTSISFKPKSAGAEITTSPLVHSSFESNGRNKDYEIEFRDVLEVKNVALDHAVDCTVKMMFGKGDATSSIEMHGNAEISVDDASAITCKVSDTDKGGRCLEGVIKFNLDILKLSPRESSSARTDTSSVSKQHSGKQDKLGSTLPASRSTSGKKNRSRHRRVNTFQDNHMSSSKKPAKEKKERATTTRKTYLCTKKYGSSAALIDNINKLLVKYSKATDATGDDFRKSLYKKFLAKEDNKNVSGPSATDPSRNINISFQAWVDVMYEILGAMDDNKILDLDHADLSKAFFRMTENEDLVKGENQISVNAFLEYINKL